MDELKKAANAVVRLIDSKEHVEYPRPYLGMSQLGHKCARNLWMYFRWASKIKYKARVKRIFTRGDIEEERVLGYWEEIGIKIIEKQSSLSNCCGHLKGHTDGKITNVPVPGFENRVMVGEIKSMAHKYFVPLVKKGLKESKPEYYDQAQMYMHHEKLDYCLHSTTNKNDEELYIEIIPYEKETAETLITKANDIIFSQIPPKKISTDPTFFVCRWCDFYDQCHLEDPFEKTCRTCFYSRPVNSGTWKCLHHKKNLTLDEQKEACPSYDALKI